MTIDVQASLALLDPKVEALNNHHRTSSRPGAPYKTRADIEYAQILVRHGIDLMADATALLKDPARLAAVEADLAKVPGHGLYDIRMNYLSMLVGADDRIKPDRMVLGWLERHLVGRVGVDEATDLVKELAARHDQAPQALDHAIWLAQRESQVRTTCRSGRPSGSRTTESARTGTRSGRLQGRVLQAVHQCPRHRDERGVA